MEDALQAPHCDPVGERAGLVLVGRDGGNTVLELRFPLKIPGNQTEAQLKALALAEARKLLRNAADGL